MLALKILPRSTKSLLRHVLTGARQHQLPVVHAPDRDQMPGNTLYNRGLPPYYDVLRRVLGDRPILGALLHGGDDRSTWVISHTGTVQKLVFGEYDGRRSARAEALLEACRRADIDAELSLEIRKTIWEKFVFLVGLSAATTTIRLPIGLIRTNPRTRRFLLDTMREVVAVGRAQGVALSAEYAGGKHREELPKLSLRELQTLAKLLGSASYGTEETP